MSVTILSATVGGLEGAWSRTGPVFFQLRYRSRPSLKWPTTFYEKQRVIELCKPIYPEEIKICKNLTKIDKLAIDDNAYGLFLARTLRENFYNHPLIAIFHANSFSGHDILHLRGHFYDNDFYMKLDDKTVGKAVAQKALKGTKFEPVLPLIVNRTSIGFCPEPNISKLLHCLKKTPQFILIACIYENCLLQRSDVDKLAKIKDITNARAELCNTLQQSSMELSRILMANQTALSSSLSTLTAASSTSSEPSSSGDNVQTETKS